MVTTGCENRFSEVEKKARKSGPQIVTRRGTETVAVISEASTHSMTVVTKNINDMRAGGPLLFNPWEPE